MDPAPSVVKNATIPFAGLDGRFANATGVNARPFFSVTTSAPGSSVYAPDVLTVFAICNYLCLDRGSV